jgi:hypothetical protein
MTTTVEDVYDAALVHLRANTAPLPWYEEQMPDEEIMDGNPYGILGLLGPYESRHDHSILGVEDQPMDGTLLLSVTARTTDVVNLETRNAVNLLRGWAPPNTSPLRTTPARGYEPVYSKFEPTLITRNVLFWFTTNL